MKKILLLLLPILLIVGCDEDVIEPKDCAGVSGGIAVEDNCGVCDSDISNDCIKDSCGEWGGNGLNAEDFFCNDINVLLDIDSSGDWSNLGKQYWTDFGLDNESDLYHKRLVYLEISELNDIIIPNSISNLDYLETLFISDSKLDTIVNAIGNIPYLKQLGLWNNKIDGFIPQILGNLKKIESLYLERNMLSGEIPDTLFSLSKLKNLWLAENMLEGELSNKISNLDNLQEIWISDNNFEGEIPENIWGISTLSGIWIDNNNFTGSIPNSIGNLVDLKHFNVSNNTLYGVIPNEICNLSLPYENLDSTYTFLNEEWKYFDISGNKFCPPYPECIENHIGEQDTSECE